MYFAKLVIEDKLFSYNRNQTITAVTKTCLNQHSPRLDVGPDLNTSNNEIINPNTTNIHATNKYQRSPTPLTVLEWNVTGLCSKLGFTDFKHSVTKYDMLCLIETGAKPKMRLASLTVFRIFITRLGNLGDTVGELRYMSTKHFTQVYTEWTPG